MTTTVRFADRLEALMTNWYNDPANVAALIRWLDDQGLVPTVSAAVAIAEKPYRWQTEYFRMCEEQSASYRLGLSA